ncbi:MAG TPA: hypothetical protein DCP97_00855 [Ruminococcaceae bacterium]|nr:hypothetical protein [Oscillospiraceae bacterium]
MSYQNRCFYCKLTAKAFTGTIRRQNKPAVTIIIIIIIRCCGNINLIISFAAHLFNEYNMELQRKAGKSETA